MMISIHLGDGDRGAARKAALEELARRFGLYWNGEPSIGRLITEIADGGIELETIPKITLESATIEQESNLGLQTAKGPLNYGYKVVVTLRRGTKVVAVDASCLVVTAEQTNDWCLKRCQAFVNRLSIGREYTPGEIKHLLDGWCTNRHFSKLDVLSPPNRKFLTEAEMLEHHAKTGEPGIKLSDRYYKAWIIDYNQWIEDHPELAMDYGLESISES